MAIDRNSYTAGLIKANKLALITIEAAITRIKKNKQPEGNTLPQITNSAKLKALWNIHGKIKSRLERIGVKWK